MREGVYLHNLEQNHNSSPRANLGYVRHLCLFKPERDFGIVQCTTSLDMRQKHFYFFYFLLFLFLAL